MISICQIERLCQICKLAAVASKESGASIKTREKGWCLRLRGQAGLHTAPVWNPASHLIVPNNENNSNDDKNSKPKAEGYRNLFRGSEHLMVQSEDLNNLAISMILSFF